MSTGTVKKNVLLTGVLLFVTLLSGVLVSCGSGKAKPGEVNKEIKAEGTESGYPADIRILTFQNPDSTWGFTIYINGRPYVHQIVTPGSGSIPGFDSKEQAKKVAEVVVKKIKNGTVPPGITKHELDSLGVKTGK